MKVAKARKSTHRTVGAMKSNRKKLANQPDSNGEWQVDEVGPVYLVWGEDKVRNSKGKVVKKYHIRNDEHHRIWLQWANGEWTAETQGTDIDFCGIPVVFYTFIST